jgi:hypothetical protein
MAKKNHGSGGPPATVTSSPSTSRATETVDAACRRNECGERGVALIAVLGLLLLISLLAASIVTISQISAAQTGSRCQLERSMLLAESCAARVCWLILNDKQAYRSREFVFADDAGIPRFMADGAEHVYEAYDAKCTFSISDMNSGFDISGMAPDKNFNILEKYCFTEKKAQDELGDFKNRLLDYVDQDSLIRVGGMEAPEYQAIGLAPLPRNSQMQYNREVFYIPGSGNFFSVDDNGRPANLRPIAPSLPLNNCSIFNAGKTTLIGKLGCSGDEADDILNAVNLWKTQKIPLQQNLADATIASLKSNFSFTESGCYTITINASPHSAINGRTLIFSVKLDNAIPPNGLSYLEWTFY